MRARYLLPRTGIVRLWRVRRLHLCLYEGLIMSFELILASAVTFGLLAYVMAVLLSPEKF